MALSSIWLNIVFGLIFHLTKASTWPNHSFDLIFSIVLSSFWPSLLFNINYIDPIFYLAQSTFWLNLVFSFLFLFDHIFYYINWIFMLAFSWISRSKYRFHLRFYSLNFFVTLPSFNTTISLIILYSSHFLSYLRFPLFLHSLFRRSKSIPSVNC